MKRIHAARRSRAGLTVLEIVMALVLLSIFVGKAINAITAASDVASDVTSEALLEDQARRVLRQIGYAVMGANRETLVPDAVAPFSTEGLRYQVNLGIQDGAVVWSDPERVALEPVDLEVFWSQNPDTEAERRVTWTRLVSPFLEGEVPNGMDDNGNGLIDEQGLSFTMEGDSVTILLTLERETDEGEALTQTVSTTVTCRNLGEDD